MRIEANPIFLASGSLSIKTDMSGKIDLSSCIATSRTNDLTCSNIEIGNQALCSMTDILKLAVELYQAVVVSLGQDVRGLGCPSFHRYTRCVLRALLAQLHSCKAGCHWLWRQILRPGGTSNGSVVWVAPFSSRPTWRGEILSTMHCLTISSANSLSVQWLIARP